MSESPLPPMIGIVGRKNSGKTTLLVAVAAELKRRGLRVASVKHGHHDFEIDHPGRDSWRHVHEGGVEAVLFVSSGKMAMVMHLPDEEPSLEEAVRRHFGGREYDLVLVEGFKRAEIPRIEIHRRGGAERPLCEAADTMDAPGAPGFLALVTDDPEVSAACSVIPLGASLEGAPHVAAVADLIERHRAEVARRG
jgi:molybdopterin-guanine dinucleotide biosynthesis protein B